MQIIQITPQLHFSTQKHLREISTTSSLFKRNAQRNPHHSSRSYFDGMKGDNSFCLTHSREINLLWAEIITIVLLVPRPGPRFRLGWAPAILVAITTLIRRLPVQQRCRVFMINRCHVTTQQGRWGAQTSGASNPILSPTKKFPTKK